MFTSTFWKQAAERGIKSAAQALAGGAAALSVLTSLVTSGVGEKGSPSAVTVD